MLLFVGVSPVVGVMLGVFEFLFGSGVVVVVDVIRIVVSCIIVLISKGACLL